MHTVYADQLLERGPHQFSADASDLNLWPGEWPKTLTLVGAGNGLPLQPVRAERNTLGEIMAVIYMQEYGCVTLKVYND